MYSQCKHVERAKLNYCIYLCLNDIPIINVCVSKVYQNKSGNYDLAYSQLLALVISDFTMTTQLLCNQCTKLQALILTC